MYDYISIFKIKMIRSDTIIYGIDSQMIAFSTLVRVNVEKGSNIRHKMIETSLWAENPL